MGGTNNFLTYPEVHLLSSKPEYDPSQSTLSIIKPRIPDGGLRAWSTVAGAWFMLFATFGYLNSFGVYQDFYTRTFLSENHPGKIAWIGSLQLAMPFAVGLISGKLTDSGYFRIVVIAGSVIFNFSLFMLSLTQPHHYYQVFLSQGVGMGIGLGLTFVPSVSILVQHFERHQALASGIALSGGSIGAVVFPIMLNHLIPKIGFSQAVRATAYIVFGCLIAANGLMRMNLNMKDIQTKAPLPDIFSFFKEVPYTLGVLSCLIGLFGRHLPSFYLQLYAVQHGVDLTVAFYSLAILNASSAVGRIAGNFFADQFGPWTIQAPVGLLTAGTVYAVLMVNSSSSLIAVSVLYGFFSGALLSLTVAGWASMARSPHEVGTRTGLALAIASLGSLGSAPVQGALLTGQYLWVRPVVFSATMLCGGSLLMFVVRTLLTRERGTQKV